MRNYLLGLILMLSSPAHCAPSPGPDAFAAGVPGPGDHEGALKHRKRRRTYSCHLPPSFKERSLLPVVVVLAGGRGGSAGMRRITRGGFDKLSDKHGFIVLYPEYVQNIWNDGRGVPTFYSQANNVDDVGFISALVDRAVRDLKGDRRRVYVAGFSNGGLMAQRVACELPDKVAAVVSVAGGIAPKVARRCRRGPAVSVLMIHGDQDPFMRWNEPLVTIAMAQAGERLTVPKNLKLWLRLDQCPAKARTDSLRDADPADRTRIRTAVYGPCADGAEVALTTIEGGGHTWPGGEQWQPEFIIGPVSREADGAALSWDFFQRHALSEGLAD
ncbi:MAG: alpha/beta fold hydrolase [Candidatus Methylomirabilota bacterium]